MEEEKPPKKNILNLIIGIAFVAYGSYRLFTFYQGAEYSTFRLIIAIGFVILGAVDLYKYFKKPGKIK